MRPILTLLLLVACGDETGVTRQRQPRAPTEEPGCIAVDRQRLDLVAPVDGEDAIDVRIDNTCEGTLRLDAVVLAQGGAGLAVVDVQDVVLEGPAATTFTVRYRPSQAGRTTDRVRIESNDVDEPIVEIPVTAETE